MSKGGHQSILTDLSPSAIYLGTWYPTSRVSNAVLLLDFLKTPHTLLGHEWRYCNCWTYLSAPSTCPGSRSPV